LKPGRLTPVEFEIMKTHTTLGGDALKVGEESLGSNSFLRVAREIAYGHHEKWDGSGYPKGLRAAEIPLSGRIMALADVYDALISKRVYKEAFSHAEAKAIIRAGRGSHFDPAVVAAFLAVEEKFIATAQAYSDEKFLAENPAVG
jgi:response regulator RpfG family c-di-GMP phosphodiesterase